MDNKKTKDRNRQIHTAFKAGRSREELGKDYTLTPQRIRAIISNEGHRRDVSAEKFYKSVRGGEDVADPSSS